ncbi:MAG TPA: hypothetical protein PKN33_20090 [Phycisphaerae bacterium]|nr:hypothetical protein [Phycisphaerae bacterium]
MSTVIDVADAVVASLNAGSFGAPLTAVRKYVPTVELSDLAELNVTVVPKSAEITTATRTSSYFDCTIDIGIQQKVNPDETAELDALANLAEEVIDHLRLSSLDALPGAAWLSIAHEPVFAPEHLDQQRVFTSVVSVTYRVRR